MTEDLFQEFSKSPKTDWLVQAAKETKRENVEHVFSFMLWDKIPQLPFYTLEDLDFSAKQVGFQPNNDIAGLPPRIWNNLVSVLPGDSHEKILDALENGAEGLILHLHGVEDLSELLKGVLPEFIPILILPLGNPIQALEIYLDWLDASCAQKEAISGGLIWTPSDVVFDRDEPFGLGVEVLAELLEMSESYPSFKPFCLKTSRYTESGGDPLDALVYGLGELIDILDVLGKNPDSIFSKFFLEASVGENYFGELARMKVFRKFVSEFAELYSQTVKEEDLVLFCQTSQWSKSIMDEKTNMIRQTYEAMSAVLGGANWLWVMPLEEENTGKLERRIARNVSNILRDEGQLDKVQDPAAGSYYLERLTIDCLFYLKDQLKLLEEGGGWEKAMERGAIHQAVRQNREKIQVQVLENSIAKIGVNKYPVSDKLKKHPDYKYFEEKSHQLNPTRAAYLVELQTMTQP